jgi:hypothetical protein
MSMIGADAAALDRAATELNAAADSLDTESAALHRALTGVAWLGAIATRFIALFEGQHRSRMHSTAGFLRDAANSLRVQAEQQRTASSGGSGSAAPVIAPIVTPPAGSHRLDGVEARKALLVKADNILKNTSFADHFPQGVEELREWRESFGDRVPTAAEAAQLERYIAALNMANYQYRIVHDAIQLSIDEFTAMARAAGSSIGGAAGLGPSSVAGTIVHGAADLFMGALDSKIYSPTLSNLSEMNATQFADRAAAGMDSQLAAMADHAKTSAAVMYSDPTKVAFTGYEASMSRIDMARATSDIAGAFDIATGDGSVVDSVLRTSLHLVPGVGQVAAGTLDIAAIAGSSAQAGYHAQAGAIALAVAVDASKQFSEFTANVVDL